jgi:hypothetical protein
VPAGWDKIRCPTGAKPQVRGLVPLSPLRGGAPWDRPPARGGRGARVAGAGAVGTAETLGSSVGPLGNAAWNAGTFRCGNSYRARARVALPWWREVRPPALAKASQRVVAVVNSVLPFSASLLAKNDAPASAPGRQEPPIAFGLGTGCADIALTTAIDTACDQQLRTDHLSPKQETAAR